MISVDKVVAEQLPKLDRNKLLAKPVKSILKNLLKEQDINEFSESIPHIEGIDFVDQVLEHLHFSYTVRDNEKANIPSSGRLVIISNHPIGSLDGLALISLVHEIRQDYKIVVNSLLSNVTPLQPLLLPVNNMTGDTPKENLKAIHRHLETEGAIIIFPAGEVSRLRPSGVRDIQWQNGFLSFAERSKAPIVPVFIDAKNSPIFYGLSMLYKPAATLLLVKEMFKQKDNNIDIRIGEKIPYSSYHDMSIDRKTKVKLLRKHLYRIGKNKSAIFRTEHCIAHPEPRTALIKDIDACEELGSTLDGKKIVLYKHEGSSALMRELGRLREVAFREVGEGTGQKRDMDKFDTSYMHLILWDENDLEIVGAYRLGAVKDIIANNGVKGLYSASLFNYQEAMQPYFEQGLELGRSFVQPRYWGKRSLDYLWFGIGAFVRRYPQYRYLFGPVSISNALPKSAKDLLVYFYTLHFGSAETLAKARIPYVYANQPQQSLASNFGGSDYKEDFSQLKHLMANMGVAVPTLFKQYSEVCEKGGVEFLDFNVDPDFQDCIDGLVLVDMTQLKDKKRKRYLEAN